MLSDDVLLKFNFDALPSGADVYEAASNELKLSLLGDHRR